MHEFITSAQVLEELLAHPLVSGAELLEFGLEELLANPLVSVAELFEFGPDKPAIEMSVQFQLSSGELAGLFTTAISRTKEKPFVLFPKDSLPEEEEEGTNYMVSDVTHAIQLLQVHYMRVRGDLVVGPDGKAIKYPDHLSPDFA
jgi:hypothetical protein